MNNIYIALYAIVSIGLLMFLAGTLPPHTCDFYEDWSQKNIPARCISYFEQNTLTTKPFTNEDNLK